MALVAIAAMLWVLLWGFAHTDLTLRTRTAQLVWFLSAFVVFLAGVRVVWRLDGQASRGIVVFIIAAGIILRLSTAVLRPVTTSDVYRYLWEGRVVNAGENPFRDPPESPRLAYLRDWVWSQVQLKQVPAAYPPVAQYVFALSDRVPADRIVTLKLVFAAFDIGALLLLPGLLVGLRRPREWALLYAWHPLIVGEVVARGHLDSVGIFFLVLAMRLFLLPSWQGRVLTGGALAVSVLAKGTAVFALPFLLLGARPRRLWLVAGFLVVAAIACLPFASAGLAVFDGIKLYTRLWEGYGSVFVLLDLALAPFTQAHALVARVACTAGLAIWVTSLLVKQRERNGTSAAYDSAFLALGGLYVLTPVLYPWYLSWTVPFLCLCRRPGWLLFTGSVFLFYAQAFTLRHTGFWYVSVIEYGSPLLLATAVALMRDRRQTEPGLGVTT